MIHIRLSSVPLESSGTIFSVILFGVFAWWFALPVSSFILGNFLYVIFCAAAYLGIGIIWSVVRYYLHMNSSETISMLQSFKRSFDQSHYNSSNFKDYLEVRSTIRFSQRKIVSLILAWPTSILFYLFFEFLHDFVVKIANSIQNVYNSIYQKSIEKVLKDNGESNENN